MHTRTAPGVEPVQVPGNNQEAVELVRSVGTQVAEIRAIAERAERAATAAGQPDANVTAQLSMLSSQVVAQEEALATFRRERLAQANSDPRAIRAEPSQIRQALEHFMRTGELGKLNELQALRDESNLTRAVAGTTTIDANGGYLVIPELDAEIDRVSRVYSGLRGYATVRAIGTNRYVKRRRVSGTDATWEGEGEGVTATDALKWGTIAIDLFQLRSSPEYSVESLEDAFINLEQEIADDLGEAFGKKEADSHINGNGEKKPKGILQADAAQQTTVAGAELGWNQIGRVHTGQAALWGAANAEGDVFRQLPYYVRSEFLANSAFYMNRKSLSQLVVFKDANKQYVWQPSLRDGTPATLAGYQVRVLEEMPDMAANATPVAFGDMSAAYLILDRVGVNILRNPYKTEGQVTFFARKRTGGGVRKGEALKLIKIAA